jgi:hypothetical protein
MKEVKIFECFARLVLLMIIPMFTKANDGKPVRKFVMNYSIVLPNQLDTLAPKVKGSDNTEDKPVEEIIKTIPKARKHLYPYRLTCA